MEQNSEKKYTEFTKLSGTKHVKVDITVYKSDTGHNNGNHEYYAIVEEPDSLYIEKGELNSDNFESNKLTGWPTESTTSLEELKDLIINEFKGKDIKFEYND